MTKKTSSKIELPPSSYQKAKLVPTYQASTPQEQGELEAAFQKLVNHVSVYSPEPNNQVTISRENKIIYLRPTDPSEYIRKGTIEVRSRGDDGRSADITARTTKVNQREHGASKHYQNLEVIIGDQTFIMPHLHLNYS